MNNEKIILIGFGLFILIITSYGTIKYIDMKLTMSMFEKGIESFNNAFKSNENDRKFRKVVIKERVKKLVNERVWINGKSLKECMKFNKELNNNTIKCRSGYYKNIRVWRYL